MPSTALAGSPLSTSRHACFDRFVATVVHPPTQTGHIAARALDLGERAEVQVTVLASRASAPTRVPRNDELLDRKSVV